MSHFFLPAWALGGLCGTGKVNCAVVCSANTSGTTEQLLLHHFSLSINCLKFAFLFSSILQIVFLIFF
jgi:hypothetical protein